MHVCAKHNKLQDLHPRLLAKRVRLRAVVPNRVILSTILSFQICSTLSDLPSSMKGSAAVACLLVREGADLYRPAREGRPETSPLHICPEEVALHLFRYTNQKCVCVCCVCVCVCVCVRACMRVCACRYV